MPRPGRRLANVPIATMIRSREDKSSTMDKKRFLEIAPVYYALAVYDFLRSHGPGTWSRAAIQEVYTVRGEEGYPDEDPYCAIGKNAVLDQAINWMVARNLIEVIPDEFGPPIFVTAPNIVELVHELVEADGSLPFAKYDKLSDGPRWMHHALRSLNNTYDNLQIEPSDFEAPDEEWEPLPLDRNDPQLRNTIDAIDKTIEQVRSDNGYAANLPEERNFVLDGLSNTSKRLKEATTISVAYLRRYALEPLDAVVRRFKDAALGVAAAAARQAIIEFLKQHGIKLLQQIFGP